MSIIITSMPVLAISANTAESVIRWQSILPLTSIPCMKAFIEGRLNHF